MKILFLLLAAAALAAAQPGVQTAVEGTVLDAITGQPVSGVRIRIRPVAGGERLTAVSDAEGCFHFSLMPGRYGLQTEHPAYVRGLGRGLSDAFQATLDLAPGEKRSPFVLRISPLGSVSGRIVTTAGDVLDQCQVELLSGDPAHPTVQASTDSAADGAFRFTAVTPGPYRVRARCAPNPIGFRPLLPDAAPFVPPGLGFAITLRPDPIVVEPGLTTSGIDLAVAGTRLYPIGGTASLPEGANASDVRVALFPEGEDRAVAASSGLSFTLLPVPPGVYQLLAFAGAGGLYTARKVVTVGEDTAPVSVRLLPGGELHGRIEVPAAGPSAPLSGSLDPVDATLFGAHAFTAAADGTFTAGALPPGRWRLRIAAPRGLYLESIALGPQHLPTTEITVSAAAIEPLRVVFREGAGSIEGTVREPDGAERPPQRSVVLVPLSVPDYLGTGQRLALAGADGRFSFPSLPPGRYRLYALPLLDSGVALDPELLRAFEGAGEVVTVDSGKSAASSVAAASDAAVAAVLARL